jgi:hypothetical protein
MSYCITVWGGATKSKFLEVERGQRCLLKVMYLRPHRFPTKELYQLCNQLTMRKLYILCTILKLHKTLKYTKSILPKRRKNIVAPLTTCRSAFAKRQYLSQSVCLYNKINTNLQIHQLQQYKCKKVVAEWLKTLTYDETELLLSRIT